MTKRPVSVTVIAWVYIVMGAVGFAYHFNELRPDTVWVEAVRLLAIVCGVFMLRGHNWARWVAIAWMALHVVVSAFHTVPEFAMHCLFLVIIAWILFRPTVRAYFRRP